MQKSITKAINTPMEINKSFLLGDFIKTKTSKTRLSTTETAIAMREYVKNIATL